jgi:hypothetical protein
MKGLDPAGKHFNSSSPVLVLQGKVPIHVQGIFERRLGGQGFGLQELAAFAAILENLTSLEVEDRSLALCEAFHIWQSSFIRESTFDHLLDVYIAAFIVGQDIKGMSKSVLETVTERMPKMYFYWNETQQMVRNVRAEMLGHHEMHRAKHLSEVLVRIGERFGKFQNVECEGLKKRLVNLENGEQGCVPLANFYRRALESNGKDWQFQESVDYMEQNGMLDESDPDSLKVIVPNYLNGPGNCIATSEYYSVCCIDECESLLGQIEARVRAPTVDPEVIAWLVAAMPSSTIPENRTLTPTQLERLHRIAERHGGRVPIHGRLFMQWMHMVYPRECAYPHLSGTAKRLTVGEWASSGSQQVVASAEEMRALVNAPIRTSGSQGQCGRWTDDEELVIGGLTTERRHLRELETDARTWMAASAVAFVCALSALTLASIHSLKFARQMCGGWRQKQSPLVLV